MGRRASSVRLDPIKGRLRDLNVERTTGVIADTFRLGIERRAKLLAYVHEERLIIDSFFGVFQPFDANVFRCLEVLPQGTVLSLKNTVGEVLDIGLGVNHARVGIAPRTMPALTVLCRN
jgi:hypothetical protein